ncbi:MAG TPA: DMT family transporter [Candidatus Limnocylindrales bacterium]
MSRPSSRLDWLLFFLLGAIWGSSFLFIKIGVETLPPFVLVAFRLCFGTLLLAAVVGAARQPLPRDAATLRHLLVLAVLNIVVPFSLITWGEQTIDSGLASILNATMPLFTIVIAALFLGEEPMTVNRLAGLVVGFAGVIVLVSRDIGASGGLGQTSGQLAVALAALSYATATVYARHHVRQVRPMVLALGQVGLALPIVGVLAVLTEAPWHVALRPDALVAVAWLGVLGSGVAYLISFRLLVRWDATRVSLVTYLLPAAGVALGAIFLGEALDPRVLLGAGLVVGGVALVNARFGRRVVYGRRPALGAATGPAAAVPVGGRAEVD